MGIKLVWVFDIAEGEIRQSSGIAASGEVDRKENRPCDETANKTNVANDFEITNEEEAVDRAMVKDI